MRQAVIVSVARTAVGKAHRGAFNRTHGVTMAAHVTRAAVDRAGIDPALIEESVWGVGYPEYVTGGNLARQAVVRAELPITIAGSVVSRFCASGLQAVAAGAHLIGEGADAVIVGGIENISAVVPPVRHSRETWVEQHKPELYLPMIDTADIVARRYNVSREAQDTFSLLSQQRTAAAQAAGRLDAEIVPMDVVKAVEDRDTGKITEVALTIAKDECNRPTTTLAALAALEPVRGAGNFITAGNASQLSDGAAAMVMMSEQRATELGVTPLGAFRGFAVAACEPDEMGIGPVFAVPRLLSRHGLTVDDIDLWELNEAFASQAVHCRDRLGIDPARLNVDGGAIALGHPFGMSGARMAGHLMAAGAGHGARLGVVTMCVAGGQGAAGLFEIF